MYNRLKYLSKSHAQALKKSNTWVSNSRILTIFWIQNSITQSIFWKKNYNYFILRILNRAFSWNWEYKLSEFKLESINSVIFYSKLQYQILCALRLKTEINKISSEIIFLPSMRGVISGWMSHTITSGRRTLNQVFVVLSTGENSVWISRSISSCPVKSWNL